MTISHRSIFPWVVAAGVALLFGSQPLASAQKGPKISVGDDPTMKEGSPELVLIEVGDFE